MTSLRSVASLICWLTLMMLAISSTSQVEAVAAPQVRAEPVPTPSTTSNTVSASGSSNVTSAAPSSRPTGNSTSNGNSTMSGDRNNTAAGNRTSTSTTPNTLPFATDFQTQVSDIIACNPFVFGAHNLSPRALQSAQAPGPAAAGGGRVAQSPDDSVRLTFPKRDRC